VAFDAFPLFDSRNLSATAEALFPGRGGELAESWRARHFEYQWLRAPSDRYVDFERTAEDALVFAGRALDLDTTAETRAQLMDAYRTLDVWPDVPEALDALQRAGVRLAMLSNMTPGMLRDGIARAGLDRVFEHVLSTDEARTYKPDATAYRLAVDKWRLDRGQILFAAFAGWDVAGARWFGYSTFWVNRTGAQPEELAATPDASGADLGDLVQSLTGDR
jgi:2-haloacid dehalogenase